MRDAIGTFITAFVFLRRHDLCWITCRYSVASQSAPGDWTLLGTANVTSAGDGNPVNVPIGGVTIPAGQTYGLYVYSDRDFWYMGGGTYSNADVTLANGAAHCITGPTPFDGTVYSPRGFSGTVYYTTPATAQADEAADAAPAAQRPGPDMVPIPAGAVVGTFTDWTTLHYAPAADAVTSTVMEPGKSLWVFGLDASGSYYQVLLSGGLYWVPVDQIGPTYSDPWNGTPLPTDVVE